MRRRGLNELFAPAIESAIFRHYDATDDAYCHRVNRVCMLLNEKWEDWGRKLRYKILNHQVTPHTQKAIDLQTDFDQETLIPPELRAAQPMSDIQFNKWVPRRRGWQDHAGRVVRIVDLEVREDPHSVD